MAHTNQKAGKSTGGKALRKPDLATKKKHIVMDPEQ